VAYQRRGTLIANKDTRMTQSATTNDKIPLRRQTMSSIKLSDLPETSDLDRNAMAGIAGGMEVHIDKVTSTVETTDGQSGVGPNLLGTLVNIVIDGIRQQSQNQNRRPL
jgi:hypothetical protein